MPDRPDQLDPVDLDILRILRHDGRISITQLAETVHISRASAYARLQKLRDSEVIQGFTAIIDPDRVGLGTMAIVLLTAGKSGKPRWPEFRRRLAEMPQVESASLVTGHADVVVVMRTRDREELRSVLLEELHGLPHITNSVTLLALEEVVRRPFVLPGVPSSESVE